MGNVPQTGAGGGGTPAGTTAAAVWTYALRRLTDAFGITDDNLPVANTTIAAIIAELNGTATYGHPAGIYADSVHGAAWPGGNGSAAYPVLTVDEATINVGGALYGDSIRDIILSGPQQSNDPIRGYRVRLPETLNGLDLNGVDVDNSIFHGGCVYGVAALFGAGYQSPVFIRAHQTDPTDIPQSIWIDSIISSVMTVDDFVHIYGCTGGAYARTADVYLSPVLDGNGTGLMYLHNVHGTWGIRDPADALVYITEGQLVIDQLQAGNVVTVYANDNVFVQIAAPCAGTVVIYGNAKVESTAAVTTLITHYRPDRVSPYNADFSVNEVGAPPAAQTIADVYIATPKDIRVWADPINLSVNANVYVETTFDGGATWRLVPNGTALLIGGGAGNMQEVLRPTSIQNRYRVMVQSVGGGAGNRNMRVSIC